MGSPRGVYPWCPQWSVSMVFPSYLAMMSPGRAVTTVHGRGQGELTIMFGGEWFSHQVRITSISDVF